jgi:nucleotide-binding universal stress UspA family protein
MNSETAAIAEKTGLLMDKTMYQTIVVGFDNSEPSKAALAEASHWVKRHGGRIILVHAVYFDTEEFGIAPDQLEKRLKVGEKICIETKEKLASEFGIEAQFLLCEGDPPEVIVEIAEGKKADLIVLGTYGRRGINRLLMGSVTSHVIVHAPVDVLVAKRPCTECTGSYRSILVPFDGSESSKKALIRACALSKVDGAEIATLYVIPRYEEMVEFFRTSSIKASLHGEAAKILDSARSIASAHGVSVKTEVVEGQAAEKIIEFATKQKSDLIAMGSYGYRGVDKAIMGSTAERVITAASCPILIARR